MPQFMLTLRENVTFCEKVNEGSPESSNSVPELRYRDRIYGFVTFVIFFGGIVPFATQFLLPMIGSFTGKEINPYGAEVWNQFVSIALGIVATILSIVSMYLGFKNSDESRAIEKNRQSAISRLEDKLDDRIQEILAREHELLNAINETKSESKQKKSGDWDDQKKNNQSNNQNPENKEDEWDDQKETV